jgi:hypothetical protein
VCHDTYAYNRVVEVQTAKRSLEPLLMVDPTLADLVRTEGHRARPLKKSGGGAASKKQKTGASGSAKRSDDPDDEDEDDDEPDDEEDEDDEEESSKLDGPMWPGLASILPVHRRAYQNLLRGSDREGSNAAP